MAILVPMQHTPDPKLIELAEGTLARVKAGEVVALAVVEVERSRRVTFQCNTADYYAEVLAGAMRLTHFLAGLKDG